MAEKKVAQDSQEAPRFPRQELMEHSLELFGVRREVIAGALHGNNQETFTVEELRRMIKAFLERKVI